MQLTDQVQKRSAICSAFVHVLCVSMMQQRVQQRLAGQAEVIPLHHAMMCLHCGGCMHGWMHGHTNGQNHPSVYPCIHPSFMHLLIQPSVHAYIHPFIHLPIHSFVHSCTHPFIHPPRVRYRQSMMRLLCMRLVQSRSLILEHTLSVQGCTGKSNGGCLWQLHCWSCVNVPTSRSRPR